MGSGVGSSESRSGEVRGMSWGLMDRVCVKLVRVWASGKGMGRVRVGPDGFW